MIPHDLDNHFFLYNFSGVEIYIPLYRSKVEEAMSFIGDCDDMCFYLAFDKDRDLYIYNAFADILDFDDYGDFKVDTVFSTQDSHHHLGRASFDWEFEIEYATTLVAISGRDLRKHFVKRQVVTVTDDVSNV